MRKLYRAILSSIAGFVCLISGCATRQSIPPRLESQGDPIIDVTVFISPDFGERERDNIINGILMWERATNGLITWKLQPFNPNITPNIGEKNGVSHRAVLFKRATSQDEWVKKWDAEHSKTLLGLCHGDGNSELVWLWLVEDRLSNSRAETIIAAHEFGHALGLDHIKDKASVMSEYYNRKVTCLTNADLEEFCDKHKCVATIVGAHACLLE